MPNGKILMLKNVAGAFQLPKQASRAMSLYRMVPCKSLRLSMPIDNNGRQHIKTPLGYLPTQKQQNPMYQSFMLGIPHVKKQDYLMSESMIYVIHLPAF